jgi:hypothetical protein
MKPNSAAILLFFLVNLPMLSPATLCSPGFYSSDGSTPGVPAPPGYYVSVSGATSPTPAPPGFYAPGFTNIVAIPDPAGSYTPISGMAAPIPAVPGYYVPHNGSYSMTPAEPGFYVATNSASAAIPAGPGWYAPIGGMTNAIPAPPGYFVPTSGSSSATPAPVGYFSSGFGNVYATPDPVGDYTPIPGMAGAIIPGDLNNDGLVAQSELNAVLTNYWSNSPWVTLTNFSRLCDGQFQFQLTNSTAWNFSVLVSSNVTATNWSYLGVAYPEYQFVDPAATNLAPRRYYRLRWP